MLAAEKNASTAAKLLIEAGADLDATDAVRPVGVHACMRTGATVAPSLGTPI